MSPADLAIAGGAVWSYRGEPSGILRFCVVAVAVSSVLWYCKAGWPRLHRFTPSRPDVAPGWQLVYRNSDTVVYRYHSPASDIDNKMWQPKSKDRVGAVFT